MVKKLFVALPTLALLAGVVLAQDAKTVLQNATKAMGDVKSIQFSGTGHLCNHAVLEYLRRPERTPHDNTAGRQFHPL